MFSYSSEFKSMISCFACTWMHGIYRFPALLFCLTKIWTLSYLHLQCKSRFFSCFNSIYFPACFVKQMIDHNCCFLFFTLHASRFFIIGLLPLKITRPFICKAFSELSTNHSRAYSTGSVSNNLFKGQSQVTCHLVDAFSLFDLFIKCVSLNVVHTR